MFVNFSNHRVENWGKDQINAASKFGEIIDVPFPNVSANIDESKIDDIADEYFNKIMEYNPTVVLCQGEFTLSFRVVDMLKKSGVDVVAACSERNVVENINEDGSVDKSMFFRFVRFRRY